MEEGLLFKWEVPLSCVIGYEVARLKKIHAKDCDEH